MTGSDVPCFQIIRPHIVNNYDKTNPLGMNIIYNSIDILKSIDTAYDSLINEFELGKKRMFVKAGLKSIQEFVKPTKDKNGKLVRQKMVNHIDSNDTTFYTLGVDDTADGKLPIQMIDPTLRTTEHEIGINMQLSLFSRAVGLGDGFYQFNNGNVARTATEIVSINSALYRNLNKHELMMTDAIEGLVKAILTLNNTYAKGNLNVDSTVVINYDDSIIEDTEKQQTKAMAEYNAGVIDVVEYHALTRFNGDREMAEEFVAKMQLSDSVRETNNIIDDYGDIWGI